ncbi:MAG TPA: GntR family transcriptional regulator [Pseudonocardia sp.]|jgi:DNA-binding GntR family transcriptional regulator|uniref:GntR family transcriptional regulator n=1 Tax=Pseudonocardia sp. TaxID=60912 RepID=UPI002B4B263F|nr:GntR family transcriptional regulator [Pseudonocardia sp.]HLU59996.1 GntR family transcriptional regulator [Pseudonocardia sp.]
MSAGTSRFTLAPSSMIDALYESMRQRIINGDIAPGEKVTEARVVGEYNVARPTAKACLERLTAAGLLHRTAHRTAVVPELGVDELLDLYFARDCIERRAVQRLAEQRTVPAEARRAQEDVERAVADEDFPHQVEADIAFHTSLVDAVGSKRLSRMHELIMGEVHLTMGQFQAHRTTDPRTVAAEHGAILAAIEAGDPADAADRLSAHLRAAQDRLVARSARGDGAPGGPAERAPRVDA